MESWSVEGKDGGLKSSVALEALAIFGLVTFLVRIAVDVAQRVRNGRSFSREQAFPSYWGSLVISSIAAAARHYDQQNSFSL